MRSGKPVTLRINMLASMTSRRVFGPRGVKATRKRANAYVLAKRPSAHMSVLMVAKIPRLVVDEALEGRRAAAGSVLHGC